VFLDGLYVYRGCYKEGSESGCELRKGKFSFVLKELDDAHC